MAITAYVGLPRSGKSYEVVSNVILPAIESGRDVVTNIAGVNEQAIYDFLVSEGKDPSTFGRIKTFDPDWLISNKVPYDLSQVSKQDIYDFYLTETAYKNDTDTFIKPGDLCAFDEVWRFWPTDQKVSKEAMNFFRMHGHFVHPHTGFTVEIALISQDIQDIHRSIKSVVLETYLMEKNTAVGSDNSYMIKVFNRTRLIGKPSRIFGPKTYNKKYFPLYVSNSCNTSSVKPREKRVDKRNNVLKSKTVMFGLPLALIMLIASGVGMYRFFHGGMTGTTPVQEVSTSSHLVPTPPGQIPAAQTAKPVPKEPDWRLAGTFGKQPNLKGLIVDRNGHSKIVLIDALSEYGQIITVTTFPKGETFDNQPFATDKKGII